MRPTRVSPCASCKEAYEEDWANRLAIRCGITGGVIELQRLKHPRGAIHMVTAGPVEGCPYHKKPEPEKRERTLRPADENARDCRRARRMLEEALRANG